MKIDFRAIPNTLSLAEKNDLARQVRAATRYHDLPVAGVLFRLTREIGRIRCRLTAIEQGGSTVVVERSAETAAVAAQEATWVLDRALHAAAMARHEDSLGARAA